MNELTKYNDACRALSVAKSVDEVKEISNRAEAMRAYAKQAKNKQLEIDAGEIRIRAERRLGELIKLQKETVGLSLGGKPYHTGSKTDPVKQATLADAGIDKHLADRARKIAAVPDKEFNSMMTEWRETVSKENERVTTNIIKRGEREERNENLKNTKTKLPDGIFNVVYADPPWSYNDKCENGAIQSLGAEKKYPVMSLTELCMMDLPKIDKNAVLFLWVTSPLLKDCFTVIESWGFGYKASFIWDKVKHNMGHYNSVRHEFLLICTKGSFTPINMKLFDSVQSIERSKTHSEKPEEFRKIIDTLYPDCKKIELFARKKTDGWSCWGNEV